MSQSESNTCYLDRLTTSLILSSPNFLFGAHLDPIDLNFDLRLCVASEIIIMASRLMLQRAGLLNVARIARCCQPAAVTWKRTYVVKTADQLDEKKRRAFLGGGQSRIDKQHKTVR